MVVTQASPAGFVFFAAHAYNAAGYKNTSGLNIRNNLAAMGWLSPKSEPTVQHADASRWQERQEASAACREQGGSGGAHHRASSRMAELLEQYGGHICLAVPHSSCHPVHQAIGTALV